MLARTSENLYWMARYLERAENTARLIDSVTQVLLDLPPGAFGWTSLIEIAGLDDNFHEMYPQADETAIMRFLIADERNPSSIASCVRQARENARTLREMLPAQMWEHINSLYLDVNANAQAACSSRRERYLMLSAVIEKCQTVAGAVMAQMAQDAPYHLIRLGRSIERADMTTRMLDLNFAVRVPLESPMYESVSERVWMSMLNSLSAYQTYRRLVEMHARGHKVIHFLLRDVRFPRSVTYCLGEVSASLALLARSAPIKPLVSQMQERLARINERDEKGLHLTLDELQLALGEIHDALASQYFQMRSDAFFIAQEPELFAHSSYGRMAIFPSEEL